LCNRAKKIKKIGLGIDEKSPGVNLALSLNVIRKRLAPRVYNVVALFSLCAHLTFISFIKKTQLPEMNSSAWCVSKHSYSAPANQCHENQATLPPGAQNIVLSTNPHFPFQKYALSYLEKWLWLRNRDEQIGFPNPLFGN